MAGALIPVGATLRQVAYKMRNFATDRSNWPRDKRPIALSAWMALAVEVKKLEREAFNEGVERAALLSEQWGGVPTRIRKLKR
jgi:hypothetical protein